MKFFKAFIISLLYFISVFLLIFMYHNGTKEIISALIFQMVYVTPFVLLLCAILNSYLKIENNKKSTVLFIGFLYGIIISILFSSTVASTEIMLHIMYGCIFSFVSFLFMMIRLKRNPLIPMSGFAD